MVLWCVLTQRQDMKILIYIKGGGRARNAVVLIPIACCRRAISLVFWCFPLERAVLNCILILLSPLPINVRVDQEEGIIGATTLDAAGTEVQPRHKLSYNIFTVIK